MKHLSCLVGLGAIFYLTMSFDIGNGLVVPQHAPYKIFDGSHENVKILNRIARKAQYPDIPSPPEPPMTPIPLPSMFEDVSRIRRDAKGVGSMPTRKG